MGWCLGRHVRGGGLLLWHLQCHLISGQDVLEEKEKKKKKVRVHKTVQAFWFNMFLSNN